MTQEGGELAQIVGERWVAVLVVKGAGEGRYIGAGATELEALCWALDGYIRRAVWGEPGSIVRAPGLGVRRKAPRLPQDAPHALTFPLTPLASKARHRAAPTPLDVPDPLLDRPRKRRRPGWR